MKYKDLEIDDSNISVIIRKQQIREDFLEDFLWQEKDYNDNHQQMDIDEMQDFQEANDPWFYNVSDPIKFWITHQDRWPRVSYMALDIFDIPPTEADNERLYSIIDDMIIKKRRRLKANTIGAVQSLRQWDHEGLIDWR